MSWGGCLATLSGGCVPLGRRLPAGGDCRVTLACFVAPADAFEALLTMDGDLTTAGLAFALDGLSSAAALAPGDFGAVGRTSLGFRDGLDSADGGFFATTEAAFVVGDLSSAEVTPGDFGAVGCTRVGRTRVGFRDGFGSAVLALALTLTTLGRRGSFLVVAVLAGLTGPGAGSLAGLDGFLWSFWPAGTGLRPVRACVAALL